jgi:hypothetical protein
MFEFQMTREYRLARYTRGRHSRNSGNGELQTADGLPDRGVSVSVDLGDWRAGLDRETESGPANHQFAKVGADSLSRSVFLPQMGDRLR